MLICELFIDQHFQIQLLLYHHSNLNPITQCIVCNHCLSLEQNFSYAIIAFATKCNLMTLTTMWMLCYNGFLLSFEFFRCPRNTFWLTSKGVERSTMKFFSSKYALICPTSCKWFINNLAHMVKWTNNII